MKPLSQDLSEPAPAVLPLAGASKKGSIPTSTLQEGIEVRVGKLDLRQQTLDELATKILAPNGPRFVRIREARGGSSGVSVVFVARHEDAQAVLSNEARFSLDHYDKRFSAIAPEGAYLLMGDRTDGRVVRRQILRAASNGTALDPGKDDLRREFATGAVTDVLDCFRARERCEFDIIGEYGFLAPYFYARRVFGLPGPRPCLLVRALALLRGHPLTPETAPYLSALYLSQVVLGQLFTNFENRNWGLTLAGRYAVSRLLKHIKQRLTLQRDLVPCDPYPNSLLSALHLARAESDDRSRQRYGVTLEQYDSHATYLLLELFGTAAVIPGMAFDGIVRSRDIPGQLDLLFDQAPRQFVEEALRMASPTTTLWRVVAGEDAIGDFPVGKGEFVCVLVSHACRDQRAFAVRPNAFRPDRDPVNNLHFGPLDGPHACQGRELAHALLAGMLRGLKSLQPNLRPVGANRRKEVWGFPAPITFTWDRAEPYRRAYGPHRSTGGDDD